MSFLLDKGLDFVRYGPFGPERLSPEEQKLNARLNAAATEYRRVVSRWLIMGVSESVIKNAGLWIDELLQVQLSAMGGGPGGSGFPSIIPSFVPDVSGRAQGRTDRAYVERTEQINERVQSIEADAVRGGVNESAAGVASIIRRNEQSGGEFEAKGGSASRINEGSGTYDGSSSWVDPRHVPDVPTPPQQVEVGRLPSESKTAPEQPWAAILPGFRRRSSGVYLQSGWREYTRHINTDTGKKYTEQALRKKYEDAVRAAGGRLFDDEALRKFLRSTLSKGRGVLDLGNVQAREANAAFDTEWKAASPEARYRILDELIGFLTPDEVGDINRGTVENAFKIIGSKPGLLDRVVDVAADELPKSIKPYWTKKPPRERSPEPERKADTAAWIEEKVPYLASELAATGMNQELQNLVIENIRTWSQMYGGLLIGEGMSEAEAHAAAVVGLLRVIRQAVSAQGIRDNQRIVSLPRLLELAKFVIKVAPAVRRGSIDAAPEAISNINQAIKPDTLRKVAKKIYDKYIKEFASGFLSDSAEDTQEFQDIVAILKDVNSISADLNSLKIPISERSRDELDPAYIDQVAEASSALITRGTSSWEEKLSPALTAQQRMDGLNEAYSRAIGQQFANRGIAVRLAGLTVSTRVRAVGSSSERTMIRRAISENKRDDEIEEAVMRRLGLEEVEIGEHRPGRAQAGNAGGGGGGEPPGGGPGGDAFALVEAEGRLFGANRQQCINLLVKIGKYVAAAGAGGIAGGLYGWVKSIIEKLAAGGEVTVKNDTKEGPGAKEIDSNGPKSGKPRIPEIDYQGPKMNSTDNATYEMGIDGKPKMFPQPSNALAYNGPVDQGDTIPWAPDVPRYKVQAPKITQPGGTVTDADKLGGWDVENEDIVKLMNDRPDVADHIIEYNITAEKHNRSLELGNLDQARLYRADLQRLRDEIVGESSNNPQTAGLNATKLNEAPHVYNGTSISGEAVELYAHKTKNNRTARLGLDKDIDEYNYLADRINQERYQERTPMMNVTNEFERVSKRINMIEYEPELAIGKKAPRYISERYPEEIQNISRAILRNQTVDLSERQQKLLKQYPEIGDPLLRVVEYRKTKPKADLREAAGPEFDRLIQFESGNYSLPQARAFKEGGHVLPPVLQRLVDRASRITNENANQFIITREEREELERFPSLKEEMLRIDSEISKAAVAPRVSKSGRPLHQALTPELVDTLNVQEDLRAIKDSGYRAAEKSEYSMEELQMKIHGDREEVKNAFADFKLAQQSGASRRDLAMAYNRLVAAQTRLREDEQDAAGRGTYLADTNLERLPQDDEEVRAYQGLQRVESVLQDRPDLLLKYNKAVEQAPRGGMTNKNYYDYRLAVLKDLAAEAGATAEYDAALAASSEDTLLAETFASLPDDANVGANTGEGTERANVVDPDEARLFMMSGAQNQKQFRNWLKFSYVAPGFGLGGPAQNVLQRQNVMSDAKRFAHAKNIPVQSIMPRERPVEDPRRYQQWINPTVSSFGHVHMKDAFHDNYLDPLSKKVIWSNPYGDINSTRAVREHESIYDPDYTDFRYDELTGTRYGSHACPIGEVSRPAEYRFTNEHYYQTNGYNNKQQNVLNLFPPDGERTMITKDRAGLKDRGIEESPAAWRSYGRTRLRPMVAPGFRSTRL